MYEGNTKPDILNQLYKVSLKKGEIAFIYYGWAGIILRSRESIIALDIGEKCMNKEQLTYINPLDLLVHSHTHWDHYSLPVTKIIYNNTGTPIVADSQVTLELKGIIPENKLFSLNSGEPRKIGNLIIQGLKGTHPRPITIFHVKVNEKFSFFHGADSGYVPLDKFSADIAFIPTGSPSPSCSPENAMKMARDITPRVIVAMHGTVKQMEKFSKQVKIEMPDVSVIIPKERKVVKTLLFD